MKKLKEKWKVENDFEFVLILLAFSLAGFSIVYIRRPIFDLLGVSENTPLYLKIPLYIAIVFPTYQILLLTYGTLLGQFKFFLAFEKKMLKRFRILK